MLYTEKEKNEIERVRKVFEKHIQQMTAYDLVWSDKIGYVWLAISIDPVYIDTGNWIAWGAGLLLDANIHFGDPQGFLCLRVLLPVLAMGLCLLRAIKENKRDGDK